MPGWAIPAQGAGASPAGPTGARPSFTSCPHRPQAPLLSCSNSPRLTGAPAPQKPVRAWGPGPCPECSEGPGAQSLNSPQAPGSSSWGCRTYLIHTPPTPACSLPALPLALAPSIHTGRHPGCSASLPVPRAPDLANCSPWPSLSHLKPLHTSLPVPGKLLHIPHGPARWWPSPGHLPVHSPRAGLCAGPASVAPPRPVRVLSAAVSPHHAELRQETTRRNRGEPGPGPGFQHRT